MSRWFAVALLLLCPLLARADLRQYVDEQTLIAAEADLTQVNHPLLEQTLREILETSGISAGASPVLTPQETAQAMGRMNSWLLEASRAGAKKIYLVTHLGLMQRQSFAIIAPVEGEDAKKLASLLYSGKPSGPTSQPGARAGSNAPRAEVLEGNVAVWGTPHAISYVRMLKPAPRADIDAALKAVEGMPIKVVVAPPQMVRAVMAGSMPPTVFHQPAAAVSQGLQWIAAGVTAPPEVSIKLIAQASDANTAGQLHQIATRALSQATTSRPRISPELAKLLTPVIEGDRLVLAADKPKLVAQATELAPFLRESRRMALVTQSMSNMRQILMAGHMFAADNKNRWPDDLKAMGKYLNNPQALVNPRFPELKPAYVYIKPAHPGGDTSQRMVLYESHKEFGNGVGVGFLDGHVEFISDKQRFDALLAETELQQ